MLKLNEELRKHGVMYPDDPASATRARSSAGGSGRRGWSLIGGRYGHTRDLVISFQIVLPDRRDHRGRRRRRPQDPQVLDRLPAQAPVHGPPGHARDRDRGDARARPAARGRVRRLLPLPDLRRRVRVDRRAGEVRPGHAGGVVLFDEWKLRYLRRDDEAYIPRPGPREGGRRDGACTAPSDEVEPAARRLMRIGRESGGTYLGDEISSGDWASRHDRYATPLHGRLRTRRGGADELALRGRVDQLQPAAGGHGEVARHRRPLHRRRPGSSTTGACSSTRTAPTSRGATTSSRSTSASGSRSSSDENWPDWVAVQARDRAGRARPRRLDHGLPRRDPRGRRRARAGRDGRRLRRDDEDQGRARPEQHHEPGQVRARPGLRPRRGGRSDDRLPAWRARGRPRRGASPTT